MQVHLIYFVLGCIGLMSMSPCTAIDLSAYQRTDGAITVHRYGSDVDPYFALKALWVARQLGDPSIRQTRAWVRWMIARQLPDGRFTRYCEKGGRWSNCTDADADDALLAMWIEVLYEVSPRAMPSAWALSAVLAEQALEKLKDARTGVYHVSLSIQDALLMDNVEIYESLRRVGQLRNAVGDRDAGNRFLARASALRTSMAKVFGANNDGLLKWSSGLIASESFYPHHVAHLYPLLHNMDSSEFGKQLSFHDWLKRYGKTWLTRADDVYPWGLVALTAFRMRDFGAVDSWLEKAPQLRDGDNWNVLEEAVIQGLTPLRLTAPRI